MKVEYLDYTWCEATEENYNKLVELRAGKSIFPINMEAIRANWDYIAIAEDYRMCGVTKRFLVLNPEYKEIHLVDGEFEFVADEQKQECQFAKYGFEVPEFESEILKETEDKFIGWIRDFSENRIFANSWNKKGTSELQGNTFNLTPIKKPWYEDESNFPCLVKWIDADNKTVFDVVKSYSDSKLKGNVDEYFFPSMIELATKEEVLSLYKEEK